MLVASNFESFFLFFIFRLADENKSWKIVEVKWRLPEESFYYPIHIYLIFFVQRIHNSVYFESIVILFAKMAAITFLPVPQLGNG